MTLYAIEVSYQNFQTGERRCFRVKQLYRRFENAERAASKSYRWAHSSDGRTILAQSDASVVPVSSEPAYPQLAGFAPSPALPQAGAFYSGRAVL